MNRRQFITLISLSAFSVNAAVPTPEADKTAAIAAIKAYLAATRAKDFGSLYERHFHSVAKARVTNEQFVQRMEAGFAATLEQLCVAILAAHDAGGGLTIGPMESPLVPGTIVLELIRAKRPPQSESIKPGNAFRIQIAPDPKDLKFYDVD
jgi:hypothetical protein